MVLLQVLKVLTTVENNVWFMHEPRTLPIIRASIDPRLHMHHTHQIKGMVECRDAGMAKTQHHEPIISDMFPSLMQIHILYTTLTQ